jgi:chaperonin GroES
MATKNAIQPLFNYVLVKPLQQDKTTPSGIVLPETAKEKPQVGTVMAVGPGERNPEGKVIPMSIKVGENVLYKKWGGNEVKVENEEWLLIEEKDVMAVVK